MTEARASTTDTLKRVREQLAKEDGLRTKLRWIGRGFPLLVLVIFFIYFSLFYSTVKNFDQETFFAHFEKSSVTLWPRISRELESAGKRLYPVYVAEVEKALSDSLPELEQKLTSEMESLKSGLDERLSRDLAKSMTEVKEAQRRMLIAKIPALAGDKKKSDAVLGALQGASIEWIKQLFVESLADHAVAFMDLKGVLDRDYKLEEKERKESDPEQILTVWLEILNESFHGEGTIIEPSAGKKKTGR